MAFSLQSYKRRIEDELNRIEPPSHRHAAPSAPWPWVDIQDEVDRKQLETEKPPIPEPCDHQICGGCWGGYPQSLFPNWTPSQVEKSKIAYAISNYQKGLKCVIYQCDVDTHGYFKDAGKIESIEASLKETWEAVLLNKAPDDVRVRALFIENMSGPVLQMLGARYNMEPFFFSSSLNWIPSRFQEEVKPGIGDHITITLTFLRSVPNNSAVRISAISPHTLSSATLASKERSLLVTQMIDTQAPLALSSNKRVLVLDLLSVHLIRRNNGSTIISYHSNKHLPATTAKYLHERIRFAGQSVYWQSIFQKSPDPTFVLLTFIWHAMYAWDEALENLYTHICTLEGKVISTSEMDLTQELHIIRAHHLHYASLLDDFRKTVLFVRDTKDPALDVLSETDRNMSRGLMERECANLLGEIERLEMGRRMQDRRLKNVMDLVFSSVNILDSKRMQEMTEAAIRDSAAMKQIAYLTMIFVPATFVSHIFGMNVKEIVPNTLGTLPHYFAIAFPFTIATTWIIMAFQSQYIFPEGVTIWKRLAWPFLLLARMVGMDPYAADKTKKVKNDREPTIAEAMRAMHMSFKEPQG